MTKVVKNPVIIDIETYLSVNNASRQSIGEPALHKNRGNMSDKTWRKIVDSQSAKDKELIQKREDLRKEYSSKVESGEIRPPSRVEQLLQKAQGHPDNESTQAAIRLLTKMGIKHF